MLVAHPRFPSVAGVGHPTARVASPSRSDFHHPGHGSGLPEEESGGRDSAATVFSLGSQVTEALCNISKVACI